MRPLITAIEIDRPIAEVYAYLLDIAGRMEFMSHFVTEARLTRVEASGVGAAARFRIDRRLRPPCRGDLAIVEARSSEMIREEGSAGRLGRVPIRVEYRLETIVGGATRVELSVATCPQRIGDRFAEVGLRRHLRRACRRAVVRLRELLEAGGERHGTIRPTVAGLDAGYVPNP